MKRRKFIKLSATASVIGLTPIELQAALKPLKPLFECPDVSNRKLVLINLAGGNDGLNTVIPLDQYDTYANLRPTIRVASGGTNAYINLDSGLDDNQQIGLHPTLTGFKNLYDQGQMRIVQSVGYPSQNKSHFKSTDLYLTGNDGNGMQNGTDSGWIGRFMEQFYKEDLAENYPLAVEIGSLKTSLGFHGEKEHGMALNITGQDPAGFYTVLSGLGGLPPENIPDTDYGEELEFIKKTDALSNQYASVISDSFNSGNNAISYPDTDLSNQLKTVARLISGDLGSKIYMVRISGFDTHDAQVNGAGDITGRHQILLEELSEAVSTFMDDLNQQNLADDVVALTFSEFGRKAKENGNFGTDHGEIAPMFLFGAAVEGGVSGFNPNLKEAIVDNNYQIQTVQYDYRQTFASILQEFLGAPNSFIDATFFDHSSNQNFSEQKISNLIKKGHAVSQFCLTGEPEIEPDYVKTWLAFPNPFKDNLNLVTIEDVNELSYTVYTNNGLVVASGNYSSAGNKIELYLGNLAQGNYFLELISDGSKEVHTLLKI